MTELAGTRSDGREQGRDSADGCGEDRASAVRRESTEGRRNEGTMERGQRSAAVEWDLDLGWGERWNKMCFERAELVAYYGESGRQAAYYGESGRPDGVMEPGVTGAQSRSVTPFA